MNKRICKKCLIRETDQAEYFKNMFEYIKNIPQDEKAEDDVYEQRLAKCKECDAFSEGMCRICGCYVEMRAAIRKQICPAYEGSHWDKVHT